MKTVYLVRHARAVSKNKGLPDFERSLVEKGIKETKRIARRFAKSGLKSEAWISSPANRAIETAHLFAEVLDFPIQKIRLEDVVYDSSSGTDLLGVVRQLDGARNSVMLFGHDPTFSAFARLLDERYNDYLPKSGVIGIRFEADSWIGLEPGKGRIEYLDYPWTKTERSRLEKEARRALAEQVTHAVDEALSEIEAVGSAAGQKAARAAGREVAARLFKGSRRQELVQRFVIGIVTAETEIEDEAHESAEGE